MQSADYKQEKTQTKYPDDHGQEDRANNSKFNCSRAAIIRIQIRSRLFHGCSRNY